MSGDPERLVDDPSVPPQLRADLRSAAGAAPPGFDADAGLERLRAALDGSATGLDAASASATAPAAIVPAGLWWALAALVAVAGVGVSVWLATGPGAHDATKPAEEVAAPAVVPRPPSAETADGRPAPASPEATPDLLRREIAAVARARALLEARPAEALALLERTRREIGPGVLGEEREALTVLALHGLGREDEMRRRGRRFLERHPKSPLAPRVSAVLDE
jgi:hypothetical protein